MTSPRSRRSPTNIPVENSSFVGRRRQLSAATRLLRRERLLTLTGAPGIGKTRLALRVATGLAEVFRDGVWLIELAALPDERLLTQAFMDALDIQCRPGQPLQDTLVDHVADKDLLLIVDNCHHLLDACVALVTRLLVQAPRLRMLTTSRQVLRATGETVLEVPPLSLPDPDAPVTPRAAARSEAVRLFADRAALARSGFTIDASNRTTVARICQRLGGIPLAIELAALRARALTPVQMLNRMDDYVFDFLTGASQTAVPRLQPLGTTMDWSFGLCSHGEQTLWARASVFDRDFDLEAIEAVGSGAGIVRAGVLDLVTGLIEKSILTHGDSAQDMRYRMLEPIRQYGLTKLHQRGEETEVRRRHRDHYLSLAEQGDDDWFGPHQAAWFTRMRREHANLRTALDFCLTDPAEHQVGLRMASALWFYWTACGLLKEGRYWLDRALSLNPQPTAIRAKALWLNGRITIIQGDIPAAVSTLEECRTLARQLKDERALAYSIQMLGVAHLLSSDLPRATTLLQDAAARHQANHELNSTALLAGLQLALAYAFQGDLDTAAALCEAGCATSDAHGENWARSFALFVLAFVGWRRGEWEAATVHARECLWLKHTFHDIVGLAKSLELLAWIAASTGAYHRAALLLGVAERHWRTFGLPLFGSDYFLAHHNTCETHTRRALGDERFTTVFRQGNQLTLEHGVTVALTPQPAPRPTRE